MITGRYFGQLVVMPFQQLMGDLWMPEISRFLGIIIAMFYKDHAPPRFHAIYGDYEMTHEAFKENCTSGVKICYRELPTQNM